MRYFGETIDDPESADGKGQLRCFVIGSDAHIIIPASSMKGAMRRYFLGDSAFTKRVFGHTDQQDGAAGAKAD